MYYASIIRVCKYIAQIITRSEGQYRAKHNNGGISIHHFQEWTNIPH